MEFTTLTLCSELVQYERCKACFPLADSFMCELGASFQEHLSEVAQTAFIAHTPEHDEQNGVSSELKNIESELVRSWN